MGSYFARGNKLYAAIKNIAGRWVQLATGLNVGQEAEAESFIAEQEGIVARAKAAAGTGPLTLRRYVSGWLDRRLTASVNDDRTRLERHVLPRIGEMLLVEVRPMHLRDLVLALRADGKLAPKSIRQISGLLHSVFKSAIIEELYKGANPGVYERGVLPKKVDKDPTWRHEAIFTRAELVTVLADERRPADRRILSALKTLAGLRHTEAATLTWAKYDSDAKPLGAFNLGLTKSGVPRRIPVHPTLAKLLAAWKRDGWAKTYGRAPTSEDLIVPTRRFGQHAAAESQKQFVKDLQKLGLRHRAGVKNNRRGHDLRRTVITLARADGANDAWLRWITHGPRANEMLDQYSSPPWEVLCAELAKFRLDLPRPSRRPARELCEAVVQSRQPRASLKKNERPQRDSKTAPLSSSGIPHQDFWLVGLLPPPPCGTERRAASQSRCAASTLLVAAAEASPDVVRFALPRFIAATLRLELPA